MNQSVIILASASPRRAELLTQIGVDFEQQPADINESRHPNEAPNDYVKRMSLEKCQKVLNTRDDCVVLGSDTAVVINNEVLGKPRDQQHHAQMLAKLSGCTHDVLTAVCVTDGDRAASALSISRVSFRHLTEAEIASYWHTAEPKDKAGGYAIQGQAAIFVEQLHGSYSGVMGLPLFETATLLQQFNYHLLDR